MESIEIVEKNLRQVVAKVLHVPEEKIRPESRFKEDLGADSLDLVLLLYEIEDRLGCVIPDEDAKRIATVADAIRLTVGLLKQG